MRSQPSEAIHLPKGREDDVARRRSRRSGAPRLARPKEHPLRRASCPGRSSKKNGPPGLPGCPDASYKLCAGSQQNTRGGKVRPRQEGAGDMAAVDAKKPVAHAPTGVNHIVLNVRSMD